MLCVSIAAIVIATAQLSALAVPFAVLSLFCFVIQLALYATTQVSAPLSELWLLWVHFLGVQTHAVNPEKACRPFCDSECVLWFKALLERGNCEFPYLM